MKVSNSNQVPVWDIEYLPSTKDVTVHNVHNTFVCQHESISTARSDGHVMDIYVSSGVAALFQFLQEKNSEINQSCWIKSKAKEGKKEDNPYKVETSLGVEAEWEKRQTNVMFSNPSFFLNKSINIY